MDFIGSQRQCAHCVMWVENLCNGVYFNPFMPKLILQILLIIQEKNVVMQRELIVQSAFMCASCQMPNSPYCMKYLVRD